MNIDETRTERLRTDLSQEVINEMGRKLARAHADLEQNEAERKQAMDGFKAARTALVKQIDDLSDSINQGYEESEVECCITFNEPAPGKKLVWRRDTGEEVRIEDMTETERQGHLWNNAEVVEEPPADTTELVRVGSEPVLEDQKFAFQGKCSDASLIVWRTESGWHFTATVTSEASGGGRIVSTRPYETRDDAIAEGATRLNTQLTAAYRRNREALSEEQRADLRRIFVWADDIAYNIPEPPQ